MIAAAHVSYPAEGVGLVLLDNPPWNFGSYELLEKVEQGVNAVEQARCRVVILASDVPGYFMAHAYLPDLINAATGVPVSGDPRSSFARFFEKQVLPALDLPVRATLQKTEYAKDLSPLGPIDGRRKTAIDEGLRGMADINPRLRSKW